MVTPLRLFRVMCLCLCLSVSACVIVRFVPFACLCALTCVCVCACVCSRMCRRYKEQARLCMGFAMVQRAADGPLEGVRCAPYDYIGKWIVGVAKWSELVAVELRRVRGLGARPAVKEGFLVSRPARTTPTSTTTTASLDSLALARARRPTWPAVELQPFAMWRGWLPRVMISASTRPAACAAHLPSCHTTRVFLLN